MDANHTDLAGRLRELASRCRLTALEMIHHAGSGHVGSTLSCMDIVSVLKFDQLDWSAATPRTDSDVFVLSKGHAVPAWYAALIVAGELDASQVKALRVIDSPLQGHPDRSRCGLVDVSTGALGQGLSMALGRAEAKRLKDQDSQVYCLAGDGECQEGQIWEAALYAGARGLSNVVLLVDHNKSQSDGSLAEVLPLHSLAAKFRACHWHVQEIDGHDHGAIRAAVLAARRDRARPSVIIAHTRKGYLGGGRVLLGGAHSAQLSAAEFERAADYLRTSA